jgi:hypothetical protein
MAAIKACPEAAVIFAAHAGFDNIVNLGDWAQYMWRVCGGRTPDQQR